jgi:hypothetical protein
MRAQNLIFVYLGDNVYPDSRLLRQPEFALHEHEIQACRVAALFAGLLLVGRRAPPPPSNWFHYSDDVLFYITDMIQLLNTFERVGRVTPRVGVSWRPCEWAGVAVPRSLGASEPPRVTARAGWTGLVCDHIGQSSLPLISLPLSLAIYLYILTCLAKLNRVMRLNLTGKFQPLFSYQAVNRDQTEHTPRAKLADNIEHPSIPSVTIYFSRYVFFVGQLFRMKMGSTNIFRKGVTGMTVAGGTTSRMFAENGGTSYLSQRRASAFVSFAHMEPP